VLSIVLLTIFSTYNAYGKYHISRQPKNVVFLFITDVHSDGSAPDFSGLSLFGESEFQNTPACIFRAFHFPRAIATLTPFQ